jgi:tryptophan 7-halogenase
MTLKTDTISDAFRGTVERDGLAVEFGRVHDDGAGKTIKLAERIVMSPETALRLASTLADSLRRAAGSGPHAAEASVSRGEIPVNAPADPAAEDAALLMRLVGELGAPFQHERSFRLADRELAANRFLLTVNRDDIGEGRLERVLSICTQIGMPASLETGIAEHFKSARHVHFGFEAGSGGTLGKLYLERAFSDADVARAKAGGEPFALHVAYKWSVAEPRHVVSRYMWHPGLGIADIEAKLAKIYEAGGQEVSFDIAKAILNAAASKVPAERLQYLEVVEDENDRRSFDLNLYDAHLQVKDMQHLLSRMRVHFGIRPGQFQALFDQIKGRALGHIAGGVHRNGRDFFNVYYGVEGYLQDAEDLR